MVVRAAMATFRRLSQPVPWMRGAAEAIYVARTDAPERVAENEAELIALLERQGVRIVVPGALSVAEQIAAFRAARLVIGAHGGGMSNIVFCQSGSFVYEMLPRHYPNVAFNRLAQAAGVNYWADLFEGVGEGNPYQRGWRIDLEIVAARLDAIRQRIAATPRLESAMVFLRRTQAAHPDEGAYSDPAASSRSRSRSARRWQASRRRAACSHGSGAAWHGGSRVATVDRRATADRASAAASRTGTLVNPFGPMHDHQRIRTVIHEHLAAGATRRHHREFAIGLVRLRVTHGDHGIDPAAALQHRAAERHRLGTDRQPPHRGAEMQAGPDAPVLSADGCRHRVPERSVVPREHIVRRGDQGVIGGGQREMRHGPQRCSDGFRFAQPILRDDIRRHHSAASASSVSSCASMVFATTPDWSRTRCSISSATSRWSRRNCLAFSRPWPIRWLS